MDRPRRSAVPTARGLQAHEAREKQRRAAEANLAAAQQRAAAAAAEEKAAQDARCIKEQQREAKARAAAERKLQKKAKQAADKAEVRAEKEREKAEAAAVARAAAAAAEQIKAATDEAERARLRAEAQAKTDAANRRKLPPSAAVGDGTVAAGITSSLVSVIFLLCRAARAVVASLVNMPERVAVYERVFAPLFEQPPRLAVFAFAHYASSFLNGAWVFAVGRYVAFPSPLLFLLLSSSSISSRARASLALTRSQRGGPPAYFKGAAGRGRGNLRRGQRQL